MKKLLKFIGRVLLLCISGPILLVTAFAEGIRLEPDWNYWKDYNEYFLLNLPWKPY